MRIALNCLVTLSKGFAPNLVQQTAIVQQTAAFVQASTQLKISNVSRTLNACKLWALHTMTCLARLPLPSPFKQTQNNFETWKEAACLSPLAFFTSMHIQCLQRLACISVLVPHA